MKNQFWLFFLFTFLSIFSVNAQDFRHQIDLDEPSPFVKFNIEHNNEKYEKKLNFRENLILIYIPERKKYAYMDGNANVIIPKQYDQYSWFGEGLAPVRKGKKWGYINTKMELVIPFLYDEVELFQGGKANVKVAQKVFQIDFKGQKLK